jgi:hypothetical protein
VRFWHPALVDERERLVQYAIRLGQAPENFGTEFTLICCRRRLGHNSWLHGAVHDGETEAVAWMSPEDLARLELTSGDEIMLKTDQASLKLPVKAMAEVTVGTCVVLHGLPGSSVNALIPSGIERIEPVSGQHRLTGIRVPAQKGLSKNSLDCRRTVVPETAPASPFWTAPALHDVKGVVQPDQAGGTSPGEVSYFVIVAVQHPPLGIDGGTGQMSKLLARPGRPIRLPVERIQLDMGHVQDSSQATGQGGFA